MCVCVCVSVAYTDLLPFSWCAVLSFSVNSLFISSAGTNKWSVKSIAIPSSITISCYSSYIFGFKNALFCFW